MNVVQESMLVAGRDVRRSLTSVRGGVMAALSIMGALMTSAVMSAARAFGALLGGAVKLEGLPAGEAHKLWEGALTLQWGDPILAKHLANAPVLLYFNMFTSARFAAALVAVVGFDAIAGDLQYGAVRYFTVRVGRVPYYAGKVIGLVAVASAMMLATHASIWIASMAREGTSVSEVVRWGPYLWLIDVAVIVAWSGFAQLIASQFRSPVLALLVTLVAFFGIYVFKWIVGHYPAVEWLTYVYPCEFDRWLLAPDFGRVAIGVVGCLGLGIASSALGAWTFSRRDV